jgi:hypothetical protein
MVVIARRLEPRASVNSVDTQNLGEPGMAAFCRTIRIADHLENVSIALLFKPFSLCVGEIKKMRWWIMPYAFLWRLNGSGRMCFLPYSLEKNSLSATGHEEEFLRSSQSG